MHIHDNVKIILENKKKKKKQIIVSEDMKIGGKVRHPKFVKWYQGKKWTSFQFCNRMQT